MLMSLLHHLMLRLSSGLGNSNAVERLYKMKPGLDAHWMPPTKECVRKFGIWKTLIGDGPSSYRLLPILELERNIRRCHFRSDEVVKAVEEWVSGKGPDFYSSGLMALEQQKTHS